MNATTIDPTKIDRLLKLLPLRPTPNPTVAIVIEEPQEQWLIISGIPSQLAKFGGSR